MTNKLTDAEQILKLKTDYENSGDYDLNYIYTYYICRTDDEVKKMYLNKNYREFKLHYELDEEGELIAFYIHCKKR
jgi:hypothetical protein